MNRVKPAANTMPVSLPPFYLNTDFHGFKGLKGFGFQQLKLEMKSLKNPFKNPWKSF